MSGYDDHYTYDEITGLQKFGDISVGDIVTISNKNYILIKKVNNFEFISMQNSIDDIVISEHEIIDFIKNKVKLRSKIITEESLKNCDTCISFNYDGSIKLSNNFLYILEDEEQCNDTLMTYYPIEKKISQDDISYNKLFSDLMFENKSVLKKLLPYRKFLSEDEQKKIIENLSLYNVASSNIQI